MSLDLLEIFDDFVGNYRTLKLANYHPKSSFTLKELSYFFELGQKMEYESFTEDSVGSERAMDLSWWDNYQDGYWHDLVLHLERETLWSKDKETLEKLFQAKRDHIPANVIGMIPVKNQERIEELLDYAVSICSADNALLIFRVNPTTNGGDKAIAYLLKENKVVTHKTANIFEDPDPKLEYLCMSFAPPDFANN